MKDGILIGLMLVFAGLFVWLLALALLSCSPSPVAPSTLPGCEGACAQGAALGCSWATSSPGGMSCPAWCTEYHDGHGLRPWADCVALAGSPDAVRDCGVSCER
jgi:hypothetical protein